jgi:hypothetical protein
MINPILTKMKEKSLNEHFRGDGLKKVKPKNRLTKKSKDIIKNLLKADEISPEPKAKVEVS